MSHKVNVADVLASPVLRVVCAAHRKPYIVADYVADYLRSPGDRWRLYGPHPLREDPPGKVELEEDTPGVRSAFTALQAELFPDSVQWVVKPPSPRSAMSDILSAMNGPTRAVYENRCPRCRANVPLREETLQTVLNGLADAGITTCTVDELIRKTVTRAVDTLIPGTATTISLDKLAAIASRLDSN